MSESRYSDSLFSGRLFPAILLVTGFMLIIFGRTELFIFLSGFNESLTIRPDHQILWALILGISLIVGGFLGLYRNYLFRSKDRESD